MSVSVEDMDYSLFKRKILSLTGVDLDVYKQNQMERRLRYLLERNNCVTFQSLYRLIEGDKAIRQNFLDYITINVSEFFRNPEAFDVLHQRILPELLKSGKPLRTWSAACSSGQEAYSLAILLLEMSPDMKHYILATDIDVRSLENARIGKYRDIDVKNISATRLSRWFTADDGNYTVNEQLRNMITVQHHDLLHDKYPSQMNLIICRNVAIYFTDDAKYQLFTSLYQALAPGGYLFVGSTERIRGASSIGFINDNSLFYQRPFEPVKRSLPDA